MSNKHFEAVAAEIKAMYKAAYSPMGLPNQIQLARAQGAEDLFVSIASQFNPRFDSVRFRQACRP